MSTVKDGTLLERVGGADSVSIDAAARTDVGMRRKINEDAVLAHWPVYLVADGMGGHEAGDVASAAAIAAFAPLTERTALPTLADVAQTLDAARAAVARVAQGRDRGAGCTLSGAVLVTHDGRPHWYVLNVGDSRVYQYRGTALAQITSDHSLRAEIAAAGDSAGAARAPRNVITRALGSDDDRHDAWLLPVATGMRLLICSDGLTNELSDAELRALLMVGGRAEAVADELVRRACEQGGRDNVSAVVVDTVVGVAGAGGEAAEATGAEGEAVSDDTIDMTRPRWR